MGSTDDSTFSKAPSTRWATVVRVGLLVLSLAPETDLSKMIRNTAFSSIMIDPVHSFRHVRESLVVSELVRGSSARFQNAYALPGSCHLPPLLLAIGQVILERVAVPEWVFQLIMGLLLMVVDFGVAQRLETLGQAVIHRLDLVNVWEDSLQEKIPQCLRPPLAHVFETNAGGGQTKDTDTALPLVRVPKLVSQLYYLSPVTMLAGTAGSFRNVYTLLLLQALSESSLSTGSVIGSSLGLALSSYCDVHSVMMLIPVYIWTGRRSRNEAVLVVLGFLLYSLALQWLSMLLVGTERYLGVVKTTHFHSFSLTGLQPSLSTLWYLSMQLFGRFRTYFAILLGAIPYIVVLPLTVRLYRYPAVLVRPA